MWVGAFSYMYISFLHKTKIYTFSPETSYGILGSVFANQLN